MPFQGLNLNILTYRLYNHLILGNTVNEAILQYRQQFNSCSPFLFVVLYQLLSSLDFTCKDVKLGFGKTNDTTEGPCDNGKEGNMQYKCVQDKKVWILIQDNCVLKVIKDLETEAKVIYRSKSENNLMFIMFFISAYLYFVI